MAIFMVSRSVVIATTIFGECLTPCTNCSASPGGMRIAHLTGQLLWRTFSEG